MKPTKNVDRVGRLPDGIDRHDVLFSAQYGQNGHPGGEVAGDVMHTRTQVTQFRLEPIDKDRYNKRGFYRAVSEANDAEEGLREEIMQLAETHRFNKTSIEESLNQFAEATGIMIDSLESRIQTEEEALARLQGKPEALKTELAQLRAEAVALEDAVQTVLKTLEGEKKVFVEVTLNRRLDEIHAELEKLLAGYAILPQRNVAQQRQKHEELKTFVDDMLGWYRDHRNQTLSRLKVLGQRKEEIEDKSGLTHQIVQFLYRAGWAAVFAAGWFFAAFCLSRPSLGNEDYFSFFIQRIFSLAATLEGYSLVQITGIALGWWTGCLAAVTLVAWLCQRVIRRRRKTDGGWFFIQSPILPGFMVNSRQTGQDPATPTFYERWLQWLPKLFLLGMVLIGLALLGPEDDANQDEVRKLLISLSGQFVGTLVALAAAGLGIIYISLVIEPRWLKPKSEATPTWMKHAELTIVFGVLILSCGLLPLVPDVSDAGIAATAFFITLIVGSLTLGYGIKYSGLFQEEKDQLTQLIRIERFIQKKAPSLDTSMLENPRIRRQVDACLGDLFDLIRIRTTLTSEGLRGLSRQPHIRPRSIGRSVKGWLGLRRQDRAPQHDSWVTDIDRKYFREHAFQLTSRLQQLDNTRARQTALEQEITLFESRDHGLEGTLTKRLWDLRSAADGYREALRQRKQSRDEIVLALKHLYMEYECELIDGYITGRMLRKGSTVLPANLPLIGNSDEKL